jgi:amino acid permease
MVGAGVLGLPFAMANLTWGGGLATLFLSWLVSYGTFIALVLMHEQGKPPAITRMDRYQELTRFAFGRRAGNWSLLPFQIILFAGIPVAYAITAGDSLHKIVDLLAPAGAAVRKAGLSAWIVLFSGVQLAVVQIRSFHHMSFVSAAGAIASLFYVGVAAITSLVEGTVGTAPAASRSASSAAPPVDSPWSRFTAVANAIATFAFAWGGHNIACEIQATLPMPPSSVRPMMHSVHTTFWLAALCYGAVSVCGYWAYGQIVQDNVLLAMGGPGASAALKGVVAAANLAVGE